MSGYRDPTRTWGTTALIVGLILIAIIQYKPWTNDWEPVRMLFGEPRTIPIAGDWEVVQNVIIDPARGRLIGDGIERAALIFEETGRLRVNATIKGKPATLEGAYRQRGPNIALSDLRTSVKTLKLPPSVVVKLAWTNDDEVVATVGGSQSLYLRRMEGFTPTAMTTYKSQKGKIVRNP